MGKVALAVARIQPLHLGHTKILNHCIEHHETVILGLGSTGRSREKHDPWTQEERIKMVRAVYGKRIAIVELRDIGAEQGSNSWCDYVLDQVQKRGLPAPTDYYTGSEADASWYKGRFWSTNESVGQVGDLVWPSDSYYTDDQEIRQLHILDREGNPVPSATELRMFMETRTDGWKKWTPTVNHELIESTYPEDFRIRLDQ